MLTQDLSPILFQIAWKACTQAFQVPSQMPPSQQSEFFTKSFHLCVLESKPFLHDQDIFKTDALIHELKNLLPIWKDEQIWRIFIASYCVFTEWLQDINYIYLPQKKQEEVWSENPLAGYLRVFETYETYTPSLPIHYRCDVD
jgi:hypothetical protein